MNGTRQPRPTKPNPVIHGESVLTRRKRDRGYDAPDHVVRGTSRLCRTLSAAELSTLLGPNRSDDVQHENSVLTRAGIADYTVQCDH